MYIVNEHSVKFSVPPIRSIYSMQFLYTHTHQYSSAQSFNTAVVLVPQY